VKNVWMFVLGLGLVAVTTTICKAAEQRASEWELKPGKTINTIIYDEFGKIISVTSPSGEWPWLYIQTTADIYMCQDIWEHWSSLAGEGKRVAKTSCYRLKK